MWIWVASKTHLVICVAWVGPQRLQYYFLDFLWNKPDKLFWRLSKLGTVVARRMDPVATADMETNTKQCQYKYSANCSHGTIGTIDQLNQPCQPFLPGKRGKKQLRHRVFLALTFTTIVDYLCVNNMVSTHYELRAEIQVKLDH